MATERQLETVVEVAGMRRDDCLRALGQARHALDQGRQQLEQLRGYVNDSGEGRWTVEEAINNAVRHAHATSLDVRLRASSTAVIIEVSDDGRGLTRGAKGEGGGIDNMMTRARLISAKFTIGANREGEGTTVRVQLPLPTQKMKSRGDEA